MFRSMWCWRLIAKDFIFLTSMYIYSFNFFHLKKKPFADILQNSCSLKFRKIRKKTRMIESLFYKVSAGKPATFIKKRLKRECFPENLWNSKNSYFKEHFQLLLLYFWAFIMTSAFYFCITFICDKWKMKFCKICFSLLYLLFVFYASYNSHFKKVYIKIIFSKSLFSMYPLWFWFFQHGLDVIQKITLHAIVLEFDKFFWGHVGRMT